MAAVVGERLAQVVAVLSGQHAALSCAQCWRLVAQLEGPQGRTRDGPPGLRTIWRGWQDVQTVCTGVDLFTIAPSMTMWVKINAKDTRLTHRKHPKGS